MRFCSVACRNKAYRRRIASARQMHAEGMPIADIADQLGVAASSVQTWVGSR